MKRYSRKKTAGTTGLLQALLYRRWGDVDEYLHRSPSYQLPLAKPVSSVLLLGMTRWEVLQDTGLHQLLTWTCRRHGDIKPPTKASWTAAYYKNYLIKEKRWLKIRICVRFDQVVQTQRPSPPPGIYPWGNKPRARSFIFQATGTSSGLPRGVVNLSLFAALMLNRI